MTAAVELHDRTRRRLARFRAERGEAVAHEVLEALMHRYPGYHREVTEADLLHSCRTNVDQVLESIEHPLEESDESTPPRMLDAARATGHRRAEQGLPLDVVLRSFRVGGRILWENLHKALAAEVDGADLRELGTRVWVAIDESSAQVATAYHATERNLVRAHEQHRAALWDGMLTGRADDSGFAIEAARLLDIPVDGHHRVLVTDSTGAGVPAELEASLSVLRIGSSFVRRATDVVGVLSAMPDELDRVLEKLRGSGRHSIGLSPSVGTIREIAGAYRQATLARASLRGDAGVALFDDHLPDALLLCAPEIADRLVTLWCGPLLDLPTAESAMLLDTLEAWIETDGSPQRAAERLYCHRNTVINRLRRISALLGRELARPAPPELALALRAVALGSRGVETAASGSGHQ